MLPLLTDTSGEVDQALARMGGWSRYFFTLSNAFWQSSFLVSIFSERRGLLFFLSSLKIGSQMGVSWAMNLLMYCNLPKRALISFSVFGTGMSIIALAFAGRLNEETQLGVRKQPNEGFQRECPP
jgi:hypothetical protein